MSHLAAVRAANAAFSPSYLPVAVIVGGTSGIGQGFAEAFAFHTKGNAQILLIGRNRVSAERIISTFPKPTNPEAKHEFIECDASLMVNVQRASGEVLGRVRDGKLNFLFMSPGYMTTNGRDETGEGIDRKFGLHYYARWKFANELVGGLRKAWDDGEDVKVLSVLSAYEKGGPIDLNDLGLKKGFTLRKLYHEAQNYTVVMAEEFSRRHPFLTNIIAFPGYVKTNFVSSGQMSSLTKFFVKALLPLASPFGITSRESGEYMMYGMLTTAKTPGVWRIEKDGVGSDEESLRYLGTEEERKKLWEHTVEVTNVQ